MIFNMIFRFLITSTEAFSSRFAVDNNINPETYINKSAVQIQKADSFNKFGLLANLNISNK